MGIREAALLAGHQTGEAVTIQSCVVGHSGQDGALDRVPCGHPASRDAGHGNAGPGGGPASSRDGLCVVGDRRGQLTRRTNPQMVQVATPVRGSNSRKLGHPLVPQKSLELTAAAVDRRRIRRIAEARPVTDDVVERVIMVNETCAFWCAVIAV